MHFSRKVFKAVANYSIRYTCATTDSCWTSSKMCVGTHHADSQFRHAQHFPWIACFQWHYPARTSSTSLIGLIFFFFFCFILLNNTIIWSFVVAMNIWTLKKLVEPQTVALDKNIQTIQRLIWQNCCCFRFSKSARQWFYLANSFRIEVFVRIYLLTSSNSGATPKARDWLRPLRLCCFCFSFKSVVH